MRRDCNGTSGGGFPLSKKEDGTMGFVGLSWDGYILYKNINKLKKVEKQYIRSIEDKLRREDIYGGCLKNHVWVILWGI